MSAGQESGSPIRENRTLLPAPLPPDEARGTLAAAAGVSTVGLRPPFDTPAAAFSSRLSRRSHLDCRARHDIRDPILALFRILPTCRFVCSAPLTDNTRLKIHPMRLST